MCMYVGDSPHLQGWLKNGRKIHFIRLPHYLIVHVDDEILTVVPAATLDPADDTRVARCAPGFLLTCNNYRSAAATSKISSYVYCQIYGGDSPHLQSCSRVGITSTSYDCLIILSCTWMIRYLRSFLQQPSTLLTTPQSHDNNNNNTRFQSED